MLPVDGESRRERPRERALGVPNALSALINGVSAAETEGYYTYSASPQGGNGTFSYQWYGSTDGSTFTDLGNTGSSHTMWVATDSRTWLRVAVTSGGAREIATKVVYGPPSAPGSVYANILGPDATRSGAVCEWTAETNVTNPVYQWFVDGTIQGSSNAAFTYKPSSSFTLSVTVTGGGGSSTATRQINVSTSNPICPL